MTSSCWYCRKGGLVDLYFAGRTGVCPKCGKGVNVKFDTERFMTLDTILTGVEEWAKSAGTGGSEPNEPLTMAQLKALPDGTVVYCYKLVKGKLEPDEWSVKRIKKDNMFKRSSGGYHWVNQIAIDGESNRNNRRCFLKEVDLNADKPLSTDELMQMDGQKVWLSRFVNGVEKFDHEFCGWHTINAKIRELRNDSGFDDFSNICFPNVKHVKQFGFNAYRTDQSHRANESEELPF